MYGTTVWTLTKPFESKLVGTYTQMMGAILNSSMEASLIFLLSCVNTECALQDTAGKQNKTLRVIHSYAHKAMEPDGLVA